MTKLASTVEHAVEETADAVQAEVKQVVTQRWVEALVRLGFATRGIIYLVTGMLAAEAAVGWGGATTDSSGALAAIAQLPFGKVLLCILTVGLIGYALWRFIQGFLNSEQSEPHPPRLLQRLGYGMSSLSYAGLALTAIQLLIGLGKGGDTTQLWAARLLSQPFGDWLVAIAGLGMIGSGLSFLWGAYIVNFGGDFKAEQLNISLQRWVIQLGRCGIAARGLVFTMIGGLLLKAAFWLDPSQAQGQGGMLARLTTAFYGRWILAGIALGLIAYALYSLMAAGYRRLSVLSEHKA